MNCQQGDVAMVVRMPPPCCAFHDAVHRSAMGQVGRCTIPVTNEVGVLWVFETSLIVTDHKGRKHEMWAMGDEYLRPFRNPGDDEQDEVRPPLPITSTQP